MTESVDLSRLGALPDLGDSSSIPAHLRIEEWLTSAIVRGRLLDGDKLPAEETLARTLGVSRMTLRHALATLEGKGVLLRRRGRVGGTFIARPRVEVDLTGLAGFTEQMRRSQLRAGASVVSARTVAAPLAVSRALELRPAAPVFELIRVRSANRKRLALEHSYLPARLFPGLLEQRLAGSLYALMTSRYGQEPYTADESLESVIARGPEAELLRVEIGSPLLLIERLARTNVGTPVEFARDLFRSDLLRITLRTGLGPQARAQLAVDGKLRPSH